MSEYVHYLEDPGASYDWWDIGVRQEADGSYTWSEQSGCSCNSYEHEEDMKRFPESWDEFKASLEGHPADAVQKAEVLHDMKQRLGLFE